MATEQFDPARRSLLTLTGVTAATATAGSRVAFAATTRIAKLFYTDVGAGRNVMLLHGWSCDSHDWIWQLPVLESKYRVVAVDLRGHGRSEIMPAGNYAPLDYAADIESLIATTYPGQKFVLVGHSMGGQIAARLAARRPDLVSAVVSVDGALGLSTSLIPVFQKTVGELNGGSPGLAGLAVFELFYDAATDPALKRWHARRSQGMPPHVLRESFAPLFAGAGQIGVGKPSEDFLRSLTVPFYHLSRNPALVGPMRSWLSNPKSKVDLWANAGHWIMQDRADDVNAAMIAWIDAL